MSKLSDEQVKSLMGKLQALLPKNEEAAAGSALQSDLSLEQGGEQRLAMPEADAERGQVPFENEENDKGISDLRIGDEKVAVKRIEGDVLRREEPGPDRSQGQDAVETEQIRALVPAADVPQIQEQPAADINDINVPADARVEADDFVAVKKAELDKSIPLDDSLKRAESPLSDRLNDAVEEGAAVETARVFGDGDNALKQQPLVEQRTDEEAAAQKVVVPLREDSHELSFGQKRADFGDSEASARDRLKEDAGSQFARLSDTGAADSLPIAPVNEFEKKESGVGDDLAVKKSDDVAEFNVGEDDLQQIEDLRAPVEERLEERVEEQILVDARDQGTDDLSLQNEDSSVVAARDWSQRPAEDLDLENARFVEPQRLADEHSDAAGTVPFDKEKEQEQDEDSRAEREFPDIGFREEDSRGKEAGVREEHVEEGRVVDTKVVDDETSDTGVMREDEGVAPVEEVRKPVSRVSEPKKSRINLVKEICELYLRQDAKLESDCAHSQASLSLDCELYFTCSVLKDLAAKFTTCRKKASATEAETLRRQEDAAGDEVGAVDSRFDDEKEEEEEDGSDGRFQEVSDESDRLDSDDWNIRGMDSDAFGDDSLDDSSLGDDVQLLNVRTPIDIRTKVYSPPGNSIVSTQFYAQLDIIDIDQTLEVYFSGGAIPPREDLQLYVEWSVDEMSVQEKQYTTMPLIELPSDGDEMSVKIDLLPKLFYEVSVSLYDGKDDSGESVAMWSTDDDEAVGRLHLSSTTHYSESSVKSLYLVTSVPKTILRQIQHRNEFFAELTELSGANFDRALEAYFNKKLKQGDNLQDNLRCDSDDSEDNDDNVEFRCSLTVDKSTTPPLSVTKVAEAMEKLRGICFDKLEADRVNLVVRSEEVEERDSADVVDFNEAAHGGAIVGEGFDQIDDEGLDDSDSEFADSGDSNFDGDSNFADDSNFGDDSGDGLEPQFGGDDRVDNDKVDLSGHLMQNREAPRSVGGISDESAALNQRLVGGGSDGESEIRGGDYYPLSSRRLPYMDNAVVACFVLAAMVVLYYVYRSKKRLSASVLPTDSEDGANGSVSKLRPMSKRELFVGALRLMFEDFRSFQKSCGNQVFCCFTEFFSRISAAVRKKHGSEANASGIPLIRGGGEGAYPRDGLRIAGGGHNEDIDIEMAAESAKKREGFSLPHRSEAQEILVSVMSRMGYSIHAMKSYLNKLEEGGIRSEQQLKSGIDSQSLTTSVGIPQHVLKQLKQHLERKIPKRPRSPLRKPMTSTKLSDDLLLSELSEEDATGRGEDSDNELFLGFTDDETKAEGAKIGGRPKPISDDLTFDSDDAFAFASQSENDVAVGNESSNFDDF